MMQRRTAPRRPASRWLVAGMVLAAGACGGSEASEADTTPLTRTLLDTRPTGAMAPSSGSAEAGTAGARPNGQEPPIDIAVLGINSGDSDALVRVVEMSDYGCGYCRQFHQRTWPTLREEFVGTGKVEWKFLPFVSGMFQNSPVATEGAECAMDQGRPVFDALNARLWDQQSAWKNASDPLPVVRHLAQESGADVAAWDACMSSDKRLQRVQAATALARQLGVRGTPTFFVVGYPPLQGALPTETFQQILSLAYEDAQNRGG